MSVNETCGLRCAARAKVVVRETKHKAVVHASEKSSGSRHCRSAPRGNKAMANVRGLNANQESRRKNQVKLRLVKAIRAFSRAYAHAPMRKDTIPGCRLGTIPLFAHLQHRNIATSKTLNGVLDTIRSAVTDHSLPSRHRMQAAWQGRIAFLSWRTVCQM